MVILTRSGMAILVQCAHQHISRGGLWTWDRLCTSSKLSWPTELKNVRRVHTSKIYIYLHCLLICKSPKRKPVSGYIIVSILLRCTLFCYLGTLGLLLTFTRYYSGLIFFAPITVSYTKHWNCWIIRCLVSPLDRQLLTVLWNIQLTLLAF